MISKLPSKKQSQMTLEGGYYNNIVTNKVILLDGVTYVYIFNERGNGISK